MEPYFISSQEMRREALQWLGRKIRAASRWEMVSKQARDLWEGHDGGWETEQERDSMGMRGKRPQP